MRILLVDDVNQNLRAFSRLIDRAHEIRTADGVEQARTILDDGFVPDVVISDLIMPDGNGLELLGEVKQRCPKARRYIASATLAELPAAAAELADAVFDKLSSEFIVLLQNL